MDAGVRRGYLLHNTLGLLDEPHGIPEGKYTFGDFARFGVTIQFMHLVFTVVLITIFTPLLA